MLICIYPGEGSQHFSAISFLVETYKIVLDSNDKEYVVSLKELEIEGLPATDDDLDIGTKVVWIHKGRTGYAAEVIELPDCELLFIIRIV